MELGRNKVWIAFPIYKKVIRINVKIKRNNTLSCICKVLSSIIRNRLTEYAEKIPGDYQKKDSKWKGEQTIIYIYW
jgi:hypothetical protein